MKVWEGFGHTEFIVYLDGAVRAKLSYLQGHYHTVVVAGGEGAGAKQVS